MTARFPHSNHQMIDHPETFSEQRWRDRRLVDLHHDMLLRWYLYGEDLTVRGKAPPPDARIDHSDIPRLNEVGFGGAVLGIHFGAHRVLGRGMFSGWAAIAWKSIFGEPPRWLPNYQSDQAWNDALSQIRHFHEIAASEPGVFVARSPDEFEVGLDNGSLTFSFCVEGGHQLGPMPIDHQLRNDLIEERLIKLTSSGTCMLTLVHRFGNTFGASPTGFSSHKRVRYNRERGLTEMGRDLVEALYRCGIIPDVAHCTGKGVDDALEVAGDRPLICSHTGLASIYQPERSLRNLAPEHVKRIASKGGMIGVFVVDQFLSPGISRSRSFAEHFVGILKVIESVKEVDDPWDHIGFGTNMDGMIRLPRYQRDVTDFWRNVEAIERKLPSGLRPSDGQIEKACFRNFLRVWRSVR